MAGGRYKRSLYRNLVMNEAQEIEKNAAKCILDAVDSEKQGETEKAISFYQEAIDNLNQLIEKFPGYGFRNIYLERVDSYQERIRTLSTVKANTVVEQPIFKKVVEPSEPQVVAKSEISIDLQTILKEINHKLDTLTESFTQLKDEVALIKLNMNDVVGKTELAQKEVSEIRNLVYAIKYER